jgi:hypothetical protein
MNDMVMAQTIVSTTSARRSNARSVTMPPFNFRSFMRGCLMGTSILLGLWVLGAVAVWVLWHFMFSSWWCWVLAGAQHAEAT